MAPEPVVVPPGKGHRVGNVEFLARTVEAADPSLHLPRRA